MISNWLAHLIRFLFKLKISTDETKEQLGSCPGRSCRLGRTVLYNIIKVIERYKEI